MSKKSIYEQHNESSIFQSANLLVLWQANLLSGRKKPNDPSKKKSDRSDFLNSDCPPIESTVSDSYEYRDTIDKINSALERIFLLRDTDEHDLGRVLDKFKPEDDF